MGAHKEVNKNFFKKWTRDMAYVMGFFAADGNLVITQRDTYFLSFYSADRRILQLIQKAMSSKHKLAKRSTRSGEVYRFQIGSKEMCNDLLLLGFTPIKSKRMIVPKIPNNFFADFIRGYFDGDGNVWSGFINKKRARPTSILQVAFTSGSRDFLVGFLAVLKTKGIQGGSIHKVKDKQCGRLSFGTMDALKLHKIMYNVPHELHLPRKKIVFEKFIKMRS
jgi:intein-encoded DNA endonuclease-like protein